MYQLGWAKADIGIEPAGRAMCGYGMWDHRARGQQTPLYARAWWVGGADGRAAIICVLDMAMVTHSMRAGVVDALTAELGDDFNPETFVLACTHSHSTPGGCGHEAMYNIVTPGFVPEHLEAVVRACATAVTGAKAAAAPTELTLDASEFAPNDDVAWNRSLGSYLANPEAMPLTETETHLALDRTMSVLTARRGGKPASLLSLFGVHCTSLGNSLERHDGDNKGYAAAYVEQALASDGGGEDESVAIFAQATAGDVSPHFHGPGDVARRNRISGEAEYVEARRNGDLQGETALAATSSTHGRGSDVDGPIDGVMTYLDLTEQTADPRFVDGHPNARTGEPCHGVAFFAGTRVDGPGMPKAIAVAARAQSKLLRRRRLRGLAKLPVEEAERLRRMYEAQDPKDILMEAKPKLQLGTPIDRVRLPDWADPSLAEMKRQARVGALKTSSMVPTVLPIQIMRIGQLALICCPGEFTTVAGRRVVETVRAALDGHGVTEVLIMTYCNDYMGYVTTHQEYEQQAYEGGHTIFGRWTLGAFQTQFEKLAQQLAMPSDDRDYDRDTRPAPQPADELALRSNLPVP
ncbi:MAG: neutral/alkaline non-lysosomal ceramidase N-terminal domain-containing protein [Candidatus Microthrix parvicella]|jgi:neutral ceramidase|uniref:neutral/alkaline non-lysosomal ceramidase N-terminal domain-containing protein n=1 Tax=Candidatus Neomicrothrix sp. TaxID=2719034 RepID=UPI0025BA5673|nr:neutral/alkaline non-lysosomal ceramidase N-terminal domain-containing protein [Candidatus Microthrix sp.]